jgi:hypothetical protein
LLVAGCLGCVLQLVLVLVLAAGAGCWFLLPISYFLA